VIETTALGAAYLAGLQIGMFDSLDSLAGRWQREALCQPKLPAAERERLVRGWDRAVRCTRAFSAPG
jgi:glycerol kinase